jgi:hypothetical protein
LLHCILLEPDAIATLAKPGTPQGSDHGDIAGFARWQRHRCTSSEATRHERQKPHQRTVHPPTAGPTTCHRAPISGTAGLLHILPNKCGAAGDFQEASVINDDARPDGKDQMLVMRSNDGVFLRWFAQADGFAQLLRLEPAGRGRRLLPLHQVIAPQAAAFRDRPASRECWK